MSIKTKLFLLITALLILVAAAPDSQGTQRFREVITQQLTVTASALLQGDLDLNNNEINNIGVAGTDFSDTGGLTLADGLTVTSGGATVTAGGLTVTAGGATVTDGGLTLSDDNLTVADFSILAPQTVITVTDGGVITPTGSFQPLTAAGAVGASIATSGITTGTTVLFLNTVNQTITITDTGSIRLSGNAALGQYDTLLVLWDGSSWIQVAPEGDN